MKLHGGPQAPRPAATSVESGNAAVPPGHVAIIMDGNGRWARRRLLPRQAGHRAGLSATRRVIEACVERGVGALTLFAFSSENWLRPQGEVASLMTLFVSALESEIPALHANGVRVRFIGARRLFPVELQQGMRQAESLTGDNQRLCLNIAAGYGGRWDLVEAVRQIAVRFARAELDLQAIDESLLSGSLALADLPDPELFIRTGGEQRISNFLLWNLAYTELYFTDTLWPDFDAAALDAALRWYRERERRFGRVAEPAEGACA